MNELRQKNRSWAEGISAKGMKDDERRDQSSKGVRSLRIFEHLDFGGSIIFFCPLHLSWPFRFCFPVIPATPDAPPELRLGMRLLQHRRRRALNALKRAKQRSAAKGLELDEQAMAAMTGDALFIPTTKMVIMINGY